MSIEAKIRAALEAAFEGASIEVINESHQHAGHAGDDGSGESHFRVRMRADEFSQMSRIARHRAVHKALGGLATDVHALALELSAD